MTKTVVKYEDGPAYERGMGVWSQLAGEVFLEWLAAEPNLRLVDVACGTGAFTELIMQQCSPLEIQAIDPAEAQLTYARERSGASGTNFVLGDAMALPLENKRFDVAVMALALNLLPDPSKGISELVRVVRPGGTVSTYIWDLIGEGFPYEPILTEMDKIGITPPRPPRGDTTKMIALMKFWKNAGLEAIKTREIEVSRDFNNFDDFWSASTGTGLLWPTISTMELSDVDQLQSRVRIQLNALADAPISYEARANAIQGRVPK